MIPQRLARMRYFVVFQLKQNHDDREFPGLLECGWCLADNEIREAKALARFAPDQMAGEIRASGGRSGSELVGVLFTAEDFFDEAGLGLRYVLADHQRWLFGAMVARKNRGRQYFPQLLRFTTEELGRADDAQMLAAVNPWNKASMSVFGSHSDRVIAKIFAIRIWKWVYCWASRGVELTSSISRDSKKNPVQLKFQSDRIISVD